MPVPANTFVALKHVNSQESLHTSDHAVINKFHAEREVGTFTDVPMTKGQWGKVRRTCAPHKRNAPARRTSACMRVSR